MIMEALASEDIETSHTDPVAGRSKPVWLRLVYSDKTEPDHPKKQPKQGDTSSSEIVHGLDNSLFENLWDHLVREIAVGREDHWASYYDLLSSSFAPTTLDWEQLKTSIARHLAVRLSSTSWLDQEFSFAHEALSVPPSRAATSSSTEVQPRHNVVEEFKKTIANRALPTENEEEAYRREVCYLLERHQEEGLAALAKLILEQEVCGEGAWVALEVLGSRLDDHLIAERVSFLGRALLADDPAIRYSAAVALGDLSTEQPKSLLRDRLAVERNPTVLAMIEAQLRQ